MAETKVDGMQPIVIVILTFVFVGLYIAAMFGWPGVAQDDRAIALLQPVVYVIIGYYFGRMPSEANEKRLQKQADAKDVEASGAKAKVKAAQAVLTSAPAPPRGGPLPPTGPLSGTPVTAPSPDPRVDAALRILSDES